MVLASPLPEPEENKRILKWSDFYKSTSTKHLSMEQSFQLQKILMDARKPFSQAENILSPQSNTNRQLIADLYDFTTELVSALFIQYRGEITILSKMTKDSIEDSMRSAMESYNTDTENPGEG